MRVRVQNKRSGAIWSSANPDTGVWRKDWVGDPNSSRDTKPYGYMARNFYPLRGRNARKFEAIL